ncbi:cytochrome P450 [Parathielavia appendiculata]|uniref:Cytochrome P450 n=1 Tax=Parathielavia appendiculata TaxID=2587402 RepID=A0AAN6TXJ0_9PEZI|nr:cytochrome P450 [Parathielavia appendiculata]
MTFLESLEGHKWQWPILASFVALYLVRMAVRYHRLRYFRGPWGSGFSKLQYDYKVYTGEAHAWCRDVNEKYGPIARIGPNSLITSSSNVWMHINTKPEYKRSKWYFSAVRVEHQRDHIFSQTDTRLHDERRKQIAPGYSGRENLELESSIDYRLLELLDLIRTKYLSDPSRGYINPMDLSKKIQYFTMDVISTLGMGRPGFGMLRADADIDNYIRSSEEGMRIANTFSALRLSWIAQAPVIGKLVCPQSTDVKGFGAMMGACFRAVDERLRDADHDKRRDMLASFIRHKLVGDELKSEVLETLIAGSDTTAGALRATMLYVMANKRVYVKLQEEIDRAVREGRVSGEGVISYSTAKQLPYLQAVIKEGLRVFPPVRNIVPKDVPVGGDTVLVEGKPVFLPGGVDIGFSALAMHRDKKVYGEDADSFRPERWFDANQGKLAAMMKVHELSFGHGRWQCLGRNVAQMELNKAIFERQLFRYFDWAIANPVKPWDAMNALGLFIINDFLVQVSAR